MNDNIDYMTKRYVHEYIFTYLLNSICNFKWNIIYKTTKTYVTTSKKSVTNITEITYKITGEITPGYFQT
jgi:hypothetical protein